MKKISNEEFLADLNRRRPPMPGAAARVLALESEVAALRQRAERAEEALVTVAWERERSIASPNHGALICRACGLVKPDHLAERCVGSAIPGRF